MNQRINMKGGIRSVPKHIICSSKASNIKHNYNKGQRITEEEYNYYDRIYTHMQDIEDDDKCILLQNLFKEIKGDESRLKILLRNQLVSKVLEECLPDVSPPGVAWLADCISNDLWTFLNDTFASHVLQSLICLSFRLIQKKDCVKIEDSCADAGNGEKILVDDLRIKLLSFLVKVTKFITNNLIDFVHETYASYVIRSVLEVCSGVEIEGDLKRSQKAQLSHSLRADSRQLLSAPEELSDLLPPLISKLKALPNLPDLTTVEASSTVFQSAIACLSAVDQSRCHSLCKHVFEFGLTKLDYISQDGLPGVFSSQPPCRLLEAVLMYCDDGLHYHIYVTFFKENLCQLICHSLGNYAVQKLMRSWKSKNTFSEFFTSLRDSSGDNLRDNYKNILHALVCTCGTLKVMQGQCFSMLANIFGCDEDDSCFAALLAFWVFLPEYKEKKLTGKSGKFSLQGTLILQQLLYYEKPIKLVRSILEMPVEELRALVCDEKGSHVLDCFNGSPTIGDKNRGALVEKLKGNFAFIACSKHGSRSLDAIFLASSLHFRTEICSELLHSESKLKDNFFGRIIYDKYHMQLFKLKDKSHWNECQEMLKKRRKAWDDILEEGGSGSQPIVRKHKNNKKRRKHSSKWQ